MVRFLDKIGQELRAEVWEILGSRDGSSRGVSGISEPRIFGVKLEIDGADRTELRMPDPRGIIEARVPVGSIHPWNAYARVTGYRIVRQFTTQYWHVGVDYGVGGPVAQTVQPDHNRWQLSARTIGIGRPLLEEPTDALESWRNISGFAEVIGSREAGRMGTSLFKKTDPENEVSPGGYWASMYNDANVPVTVVLNKITGMVRPFEFSDELAGIAYTMTRIFANFHFNELGEIARYKGTYNNTVFLGGDPGHVRCEDATMDEVGMVVDDGSTQSVPGIATRIAVSFLWSDLPFIGPGSPLALVPQVVDDKTAAEASVFIGTDKVVEYLFPVRGMDFDSLIQTIERFGSPIRRAGGHTPVP